MDSQHPSGIPWIVGTPRTSGGSSDLLALVIGRGWADTSIAAAGAHAVVAAVLRRELSRPVEAPGGGVHQVDVHVEVGLQDTVVVTSGGAAGVSAASRRLEQLLTHPEELVFEIPEDAAQAVAHPFAGWGQELAAWFGPGPATVFANVVPTWSGTLDELHAALRALRPGPELAAVGATTVPELGEQMFAGVVSSAVGRAAARPTALRWRDPSDGPVPGPAEHLLSARVPGGTAGRAAMTLLVQTLHRSFDVMCPVRGLYADACPIGADQLLTVTVQPHQELDADGAAAAVDAALDAMGALSDEVIDAALAEQRTDEVLARRTGLVSVALTAIRTGRLLAHRELVEEARSIGADDVRAAVDTVRSRILLTRRVLEPEAREKVSKTEIPGGSPKSWHPPKFAIPTERGARKERVLVDGRRLTVQSSALPRGYGGQPRTVMDLDRVVARLDQGADSTVLIDEGNRRIQLFWAALTFPDRLRRILSAAVPADRTMVLPPNVRVQQILAEVKRRGWRVVRWILGVVVLLALLGVAVIIGFGLNRSSDGGTLGVSLDLSVGQTGTLPNGTTITVTDPRLVDNPNKEGDLLLADVRYCAGSVQPSDERDYEIRNYVDDSKFTLQGTNNNRSAYWPPGVKSFDMTTLQTGECLTRTIVYEVPKDLPEAGIYVQFSNVVGDQVIWRGVRPTR